MKEEKKRRNEMKSNEKQQQHKNHVELFSTPWKQLKSQVPNPIDCFKSNYNFSLSLKHTHMQTLIHSLSTLYSDTFKLMACSAYSVKAGDVFSALCAVNSSYDFGSVTLYYELNACIYLPRYLYSMVYFINRHSTRTNMLTKFQWLRKQHVAASASII